jgi:transposase-like protein
MKHPDELAQRGVRLALEGDRLIAQIAHDLGMHAERLRQRAPGGGRQRQGSDL